MTGCELPDCSVVYDVKSEKSTLFIPPVVEDEVVWSGLPLTKEEALKRWVLCWFSCTCVLSVGCWQREAMYCCDLHFLVNRRRFRFL